MRNHVSTYSVSILGNTIDIQTSKTSEAEAISCCQNISVVNNALWHWNCKLRHLTLNSMVAAAKALLALCLNSKYLPRLKWNGKSTSWTETQGVAQNVTRHAGSTTHHMPGGRGRGVRSTSQLLMRSSNPPKFEIPYVCWGGGGV